MDKFVQVLIEKNAVPMTLLDEAILTRRLKKKFGFVNHELEWFSIPMIYAVLNKDLYKERSTLG